MAVYEGMFILDPAKFSRDPGAAAQQVTDLITGHGGTVLVGTFGVWRGSDSNTQKIDLAAWLKGQKRTVGK